jgi:predicted nucleic acid-binding protein
MPAEAVLDTSVWKAVLDDEPAAAGLAAAQGEATAVVTPIVLAELTGLLKRGRLRRGSVVERVEEVARYEALTREDALEGGRIYARLRNAGNTKVGLGDCLIYATARRIGATLVTVDGDLRGEPGVVVLAR